MPILNEAMTFSEASEYYRKFVDGDSTLESTFVGGNGRRTLLPAGFQLFKFSAYGFIPTRSGKPFSPWWSGTNGIPETDHPGLDGLLAAAKGSGLSTLEFARRYFAVKSDWNELGISQLGMVKVLRGSLAQPVYGFVGRCQRMNNEKGPVVPDQHRMHVLAGGAWQIFIPNLTAETFNPTGMNLVP